MQFIQNGAATIEFYAGTDIATACGQAIMLAKDIRGLVHFTFNGIDMTATPTITASDLVRRWDSRLEYEAMVRRLPANGNPKV